MVPKAAAASFDDVSARDLPYDDRQAVLTAMESCDHCATAAEVAGLTGLSIAEAGRLLQWLTYETQGSMRVRSRALSSLPLARYKCPCERWPLIRPAPRAVVDCNIATALSQQLHSRVLLSDHACLRGAVAGTQPTSG